MRVVYVGAFGRSGSTLLDRVLGELPGVCALGEVTQLWHRARRDDIRCGCGAPFARCPFWIAVGDHAFGGWHRVDLGRIPALQRTVGRTRSAARLARRPTGDRLAMLAEYTHYYARVYAAAAAVSQAPVIVDSSKNPGLALSLRWSREVDLRLVHLVRDPRGVAYSWTRQRASGERGGGAMMLRMPPVHSAVQWSAYNCALSLLGRAGRRRGGQRDTGPAVRVHRLRYEDFVADPATTVRALGEFMGLRLTAADLSYLAADRAELGARHGVAGNPMRFTTGSVRLRQDDAWRTALPKRQRRLVSAVCAPLLTAYGYPLAVRRRA